MPSSRGLRRYERGRVVDWSGERGTSRRPAPAEARLPTRSPNRCSSARRDERYPVLGSKYLIGDRFSDGAVFRKVRGGVPYAVGTLCRGTTVVATTSRHPCSVRALPPQTAAHEAVEAGGRLGPVRRRPSALGPACRRPEAAVRVRPGVDAAVRVGPSLEAAVRVVAGTEAAGGRPSVSGPAWRRPFASGTAWRRSGPAWRRPSASGPS